MSFTSSARRACAAPVRKAPVTGVRNQCCCYGAAGQRAARGCRQNGVARRLRRGIAPHMRSCSTSTLRNQAESRHGNHRELRRQRISPLAFIWIRFHEAGLAIVHPPVYASGSGPADSNSAGGEFLNASRESRASSRWIRGGRRRQGATPPTGARGAGFADRDDYDPYPSHCVPSSRGGRSR